MHRYAKALIVILASVTAGAYVSKVKIAVTPTPPEAAVTEPEAPILHEDGVEVLPIHSMTANELARIGSFGEPKRLDPVQSCDIAAVVTQTATDPELAAYPIKAGTDLHSYFEVRFEALSERSDYDLDIAVRVLDLDTCTTEVIGIKKTYGTGVVRVPVRTSSGTVWKEERKSVAHLEAPSGWDIEVVRRAQGVEWNNWGTEFHIAKPARHIVVGVRWPHVPNERATGQSRITPVTYVPYSRELHLDSLILAGKRYIDELGQRAHDELRRLGVESKAFPGTLVSDVKALELGFVTSLAINEHMDPGEFALDPKWTADRIHIVIAANREHTAAYTCSGASACGLMQFTDSDGNGTYTTMRVRYPAAKLMGNFTEGARNHLNAMKAAILLHDNNLAYFRERLGAAAFTRLIADRVALRERLNSAYNTGAGRTANVHELAEEKKLSEWTDAKGSCRKPTYRECLLIETKGYIAKDRYLHQFWFPELVTRSSDPLAALNME